MPEDYGLVCIDEDVYKKVQTTLEDNCDSLDNVKTDFENIISSSNEALAVILKSQAPLSTYIESLSQKTLELNARIQLAIDQYKKIDEDSTLLLSTFNEYLDDLFSSALDEASLTSFNELTFEERMEQLNQIAQGYESVLNQLQEEFEKLYGEGIPISIEAFNDLNEVFTLFNVYDLAGVVGGWQNTYNGSEDGKYRLDPASILKVMDFCWESGILDKIDSYLNGASWEESGLMPYYMYGEFYNPDPKENERLYLYSFSDKYKDLESLRAALQPKMDEIFATFEELENLTNDYLDRVNDISILSEKVHSLKLELKILPFEQYMQDSEFYKFLEKNYKDYNEKHNANLRLEFMSQEEVALYDYLSTIDNNLATEYLDAIQEKINERAGFQQAVNYVQWINEGGASVTDGFKALWEGSKDGVKIFGNGLINVFFADGIKSDTDYALMYKTILMNCANEYNDQLSDMDRLLLGSAYDAGKTIGQQAIPALLSFVPVVGEPLGNALKTASNYGNSVESLMQQGYTGTQSALYSIINTGLSGLSNKAMGVLGQVSTGSVVVDNYFKNIISTGSKNVVNWTSETLALGESFDHSIEDVFDNFNASNAAISAGTSAANGRIKTSINNGIDRRAKARNSSGTGHHGSTANVKTGVSSVSGALTSGLNTFASEFFNGIAN